jgi:hypothetical protein
MTRASRWAGAVLLVVLGLPVPARAQIVQSVNFGAGWFWPAGYNSRTPGDVLVANLTQPIVAPGATGSLDFDIGEFGAWTFFGEWNVALNRHVEVSGGLSFYQETVHSRYADLVDSQHNFSDIQQDLTLRMIPITGIVRFLPVGKPGSVQPYVGGGIAAINFQYTEKGDFVDTSDVTLPIYCAGSPGCVNPAYQATGMAFGPVFVGGVRLPIGGDLYGITLEGRYQWVKGDLPTAAECQNDLSKCFAFGATKLDLSGFTFNMGMLIRF